MEIEKIILEIKDHHNSFIDYISDLPEKEFLRQKNNKWSAGEQLNHIYLSVKPVSLVLSSPKFIMKGVLGKSKKKSLTYDELVVKYQTSLNNGAKATKKYIPKLPDFNQKEKIISALHKEIRIICTKIKKYNEEELDTILLPHPIIGKLTLRELLYFTIYHVQHHLKSLQQDLQ